MEKTKNYRMKFVKFLKGEYVQYQVRLICLDDNTINVEFLDRYSTMKDFHEVLKKEANSINFPKFPPKKFFGSTDDNFLKQRSTALEYYFNTILGSKEFSNIPSLKKWIDGLIKKYNKPSGGEKNKNSGGSNQITGNNGGNQVRPRMDSNPNQNNGTNQQSFLRNNGKIIFNK